MIQLSFNSFDSLFNGLILKVLKSPNSLVESYSGGGVAYLFPLLLKVKPDDSNLNLGNVHYKVNKFNYLVKKYIDEEKAKSFLEKAKNSTGTTITLYFKTEKPQVGTTTDNGPCLLNVVLSRKDRKSKWSRMFVNFRTTEINRRFYADLVFISKMLKEIPDEAIEEVYLNIPKSFVNLYYLVTQTTKDEEKDKGIKEKLDKIYNDLMDPIKGPPKYKSIKRVYLILTGKKKKTNVDLSKAKIFRNDCK